MNTADLQQRAHAGDPDAQFELGRQHAARQEFTRARRLLRSAAERGHAGALTELGLFALFGIGTDVDQQAAVDLLRKAEAAGSGEASYHRAMVDWCAEPTRFDPDAIARRLLQAAQRDFPDALRALALIYARIPERAALSEPCLQRATLMGDAVSPYLLGRRAWLAGEHGRARGLLALAAARGTSRAGALCDLAGVAPADLAVWRESAAPAVQPEPQETTEGDPPVVHSADPLVQTRDHVFSAVECEYAIALGEPRLDKSIVMNDVTAQTARTDYRTSSDHAFQTFQDDFGLRWLQWRLLRTLDVPMLNAEPLLLLRYLPGEEYKPHRDYLPPTGFGQAGQRVHTVFCYLSDVDAGGETDFPLLKVRVTPKQGRVVHFRNVLANGEPDPRTLHAGLPVTGGTKWLATLWTRERRFRDY